MDATREAKSRFESFALDPARQPPPSIDLAWQAPQAGAVTARARLLLPEEAAWNQAPDGSPLLFNDRWVWLAEVELDAGPSATWVADETTLELNDPEMVLSAAAIADDVLGDLIFWALQEERAGLGEGLVARTRAAGGFREAYLPRRVAAGEPLTGLVAFPAVDADGLHVVAARLTLAVDVEGRREQVVWVFQ